MRIRTMGLFVAAVAVLSLLTACASTDTGITANVKARLAADDLVELSQITVTAVEGTVTLTGNVDSAAVKERALDLARGTTGVTSVVDMISAQQASGGGNAPEPERTLGEHFDDAGITMRVKDGLLDDPLVQGLNIDVDTRDGIVFLTGSVGSDAERTQAIQIARDQKGVLDVQANLKQQKS